MGRWLCMAGTIQSRPVGLKVPNCPNSHCCAFVLLLQGRQLGTVSIALDSVPSKYPRRMF